MNRATLALLCLLMPSCAFAATVAGEAVVIDGDTVRINGERVRLIGIDAPERDQLCRGMVADWECGTAAAHALSDLIGNELVTCSWSARDQYDRILGQCATASVPDVNLVMVTSGLAWSYLSPMYQQAENGAHQQGIGVWQAATQPPWEYRSQQQAQVLANQPAPPDPNCIIKGNINSAGERIFHEPRTPGYEATVIRTENGERWFCSIEEAIHAGWRRPLG